MADSLAWSGNRLQCHVSAYSEPRVHKPSGPHLNYVLRQDEPDDPSCNAFFKNKGGREFMDIFGPLRGRMAETESHCPNSFLCIGGRYSLRLKRRH